MEFVISLITAGLIGATAGGLGALMVSKRMSLIGGPLGHLALPGVALALSFSFNIFIGALLTILCGMLLIWMIEQRTDLPIETVTGLVFAVGVALGFLLLPLEQAEEAVVGNITRVGVVDLLLSAGLTVLVFTALRKISAPLVLLSLSRELALGKGIKERKISFFYLLLIALTVSLEVKLLGILLTAALFVIPAASSRNITNSFRPYILFSVLFGSLSCMGGVVSYEFTGAPAGPLMIVFAGLFFASCLLIKEFRTKK